MAAIQENISRSAMILITGIVGLVFVYSRMRFMEVPFDRDEAAISTWDIVLSRDTSPMWTFMK
ncbi:MAG: hypothetical protein IPF52_16025 [Saprospiraceae bacterium]|nr:hypothetical protein [Saprospiraceae bacterium]